eukprot:TRINITY_DN16697_c0_g1_i1.p1 TRINITY_DN16697_c0_g1~~TRINITY_DN16697_c0_g1_i1.p1  ORF type:complete len:205 (+),score=31.19 TRINITY_DN16697_c0_g1_i1:55-669(+)
MSLALASMTSSRDTIPRRVNSKEKMIDVMADMYPARPSRRRSWASSPTSSFELGSSGSWASFSRPMTSSFLTASPVMKSVTLPRVRSLSTGQISPTPVSSGYSSPLSSDRSGDDADFTQRRMMSKSLCDPLSPASTTSSTRKKKVRFAAGSKLSPPATLFMALALGQGSQKVRPSTPPLVKRRPSCSSGEMISTDVSSDEAAAN